MLVMKYTPKGRPNAKPKYVRLDKVEKVGGMVWICVTANLHLTEGKRINYWMGEDEFDAYWVREFGTQYIP